MLGLTLGQVGILLAGIGFVAIGLAGLVPLALAGRRDNRARDRLLSLREPVRVTTDEEAAEAPPAVRERAQGIKSRIGSWAGALSAIDGFLRPMPEVRIEGVALESPVSAPPLVSAPPPAVAAPVRLRPDEIPAAEELLAQLFTLRLTVSELTAEVQALRESFVIEDEPAEPRMGRVQRSLVGFDDEPDEEITAQLPEVA